MTPLIVTLGLVSVLAARPQVAHIKAAQAAYDEAQKAARDKQVELAVALFRKTIEIEPTFMEAYDGLARLYLDANRRLDSAAVITRLLEIEPSASQYRLLLGKILLEEKEWTKALAQFTFVLRTDSLNADALLGFASAASQAGMPDRASDALERGHRKYPLDERFKQSAVKQSQ